MKAAILEKLGDIPKYGEISEPSIENENQIIIKVKASTIKQLDKLKASGKHYTTYPSFPTTVGFDGTGILNNGKRVYSQGISGMIAEKAIISSNNYVEIPDSLDFETAAAIPNALMGSDMALLFQARMKKGDCILINGATGITGKTAVQLAKYRGASKIVVTGRNEKSLEELKTLGAYEIISLKDSDENIISNLTKISNETPFDIILDYLWGNTMEFILKAIENTKFHPVRIVTIGNMAGTTINLTSNLLRSKQIEILGSGIGSLKNEDIVNYMKNILPEIFQLAAERKLKIDTEIVDLKDVEKAWQSNSRKRIVIRI